LWSGSGGTPIVMLDCGMRKSFESVMQELQSALSGRDAAAFTSLISSTLRSNSAAFPLLRGELALLLVC
jgi:hypothetical protein